jgi:hypothetical protein
LYRRLGGPQGLSGQAQKISPPTGFDPQTVQPVASRYTNRATRPAKNLRTLLKFLRPEYKDAVCVRSIGTRRDTIRRLILYLICSS